MRRLMILVLTGLSGPALLLSAGIPVSACSYNDSQDTSAGFSCALYPSDGAGIFSGKVRVNFPGAPAADPITPGYIVLDSNSSAIDADDPTVPDPNLSDWTQLLQFVDPADTGVAQYIQLFTVGCANDGNTTDRSCFPAYADVIASGSYAFFTEPADNRFTLNPCPNCVPQHAYSVTLIHEAAANTPEPGTSEMAAVLSGVMMLLRLTRNHRQKRI